MLHSGYVDVSGDLGIRGVQFRAAEPRGPRAHDLPTVDLAHVRFGQSFGHGLFTGGNRSRIPRDVGVAQVVVELVNRAVGQAVRILIDGPQNQVHVTGNPTRSDVTRATDHEAIVVLVTGERHAG